MAFQISHKTLGRSQAVSILGMSTCGRGPRGQVLDWLPVLPRGLCSATIRDLVSFLVAMFDFVA